MKNKYLKIFVLISLVLLVAMSLVACGNKSAAKDDEGGWEGISWTYKKDSKTLTITGSGAMPSAKSAEEVSWAAVRGDVEKVVFAAKDGKYITNIGDYAFYGMSKLTTISLPEGVTSIGKCSFAFCSSLENISVPATVNSVGASAFEACVSLRSIALPEAVSSVGDRAFAFCKAMTTVTMAGQVDKIGPWTFKSCEKLATVTMITGSGEIDKTAFENAKIKAPTYKEAGALSDKVTVITYYINSETGEAMGDPKKEIKNRGEAYSTSANLYTGYEVIGESIATGNTASAEGNTIEVTFKYRKIAETEAPKPTEAPKETKAPDTNKGFTTENIIGIIVLVVVIVGICVGAVLLVISNKKQQKKGTTVRKNDTKKK